MKIRVKGKRCSICGYPLTKANGVTRPIEDHIKMHTGYPSKYIWPWNGADTRIPGAKLGDTFDAEIAWDTGEDE